MPPNPRESMTWGGDRPTRWGRIQARAAQPIATITSVASTTVRMALSMCVGVRLSDSRVTATNTIKMAGVKMAEPMLRASQCAWGFAVVIVMLNLSNS